MSLVGHQKQRELLRALAKHNRLPPVMLFVGSPGIGKKLVAKELFQFFICEDPNAPPGGCGLCNSCRTFLAGNFPDYHEIDCLTESGSSVDTWRALLSSLHLTSFSGRSRFVLIDHADELSVQVANILLKTLEEPPKDTYFIFILVNPSSVPVTLRSRSQVWFFDQLSLANLEEIAGAQNFPLPSDPKKRKEVLALAEGSVQNLKEKDTLSEDWKIVNDFLSNLAVGDATNLIRELGDITKNKDRLRVVLPLFRIAARSYMRDENRTEVERANWAITVLNLLHAERLIFDRNLHATLVMQTALLHHWDKIAAHKAQLSYSAPLLSLSVV